MRRTKYRNGRVTRIRDLPMTARVLLWLVGIAMVGILLLVTWWVAVAALFAWIAFKGVPLGGESNQSTFEPTDPNDHRRNLFYDPIAYADDPDPRFDDK